MRHALHWFEIPVTDMARAVAFYEATLQTRLRRESMGETGGELAVFPVDPSVEDPGATGCLFAPLHQRDIVPSTHGSIVYLNAGDSLAATLQRAQAAGAPVLLPATALPPGMGHFAHIQDSEGNRVGLHALNP